MPEAHRQAAEWSPQRLAHWAAQTGPATGHRLKRRAIFPAGPMDIADHAAHQRQNYADDFLAASTRFLMLSRNAGETPFGWTGISHCSWLFA